MEQKKISKIILIILVIIFLVTGGFYYLAWKKVKDESSSKALLKSTLLYADLDEATLDCLDEIPVEGNFENGRVRFEKKEGYADYVYRAVFDSIEEINVKKCHFIKLNLTYEPTGIASKFSIYLPENMPSPGTNKNTMPGDLKELVNKKIEFKVRYGVSSNDSINKILGWQLINIFLKGKEEFKQFEHFYK